MRYTLPCLICILCSFSLSAQNIQPVLQSGHSSKIEFYSVSHDKNVLMTADQNEIMLWNTLSGKQLRRIAIPYKIKGATLSKNGEEVIVITYEYGKDASVRIYSSVAGVLLSTISLQENNWGSIYYPTMDELIFDSKFNRVAIRSFNKVVIIDIDARKKIHQFKLSSYDNDLSFTGDKNIFSIAFTENNKLLAGLIDTIGNIIQTAEISADTKQAGLINDPLNDRFYLLDNKAVIHVLNNKLQQIDSIVTDSSDRISSYSVPKMNLSADGKKILVPLHEHRYFYDLEKKKWVINNWKWINYSTVLLFINETADKIAKISDLTTEILDAESGELVHLFAGERSSDATTIFSPSGRMMSAFEASTASKTTNILDLKTGMQFGEEIDLAVFYWITDSMVLCAPAYPEWRKRSQW